MEKLWNDQSNRGENKLKVMQGLEDYFKEYELSLVTHE